MHRAHRAEIQPTIDPWLSIASRSGIIGFKFEFRLRRATYQPFSRASPGRGSLQSLKTRLFAPTHADQTHLRSRVDLRFELIEQPLDPGAIIANREYVTPGGERTRGAFGQIADGCRAGHAQIIGEHQPPE